MPSQTQNPGQRLAQSRVLECDNLYAQKRANFDSRKKGIEQQFEMRRQRKQQRDRHATELRNRMLYRSGYAEGYWGHGHYNTKHVLYPHSPTLETPQGMGGPLRENLCGSMEQYLPATTYDPTAIAARAVRPRFAQPNAGRDAREGLCVTGPDTDLDQLQRLQSAFKDSPTSLKPSSRKGKSLESDQPAGTAIQDVMEKWHINNMSGVGHQEDLRKGNVTVPSPSVQDLDAPASIKWQNTALDKLIRKRNLQSVSHYPVPVSTKAIVASGPSGDKVSKTVTFKTESSNPTHNDSVDLNKPDVMSKAAVKGPTSSRPGLKLDTTFLSSEPKDVEWSNSDSIEATAGSTIADELSTNELPADSDCLHMPLVGQSSAHESILPSSKTSKLDATATDNELGSSEKFLDTTPPPPSSTQETGTKLDAVNDEEEVKPNLEEDLETLTLTSEEGNSPSPDIDDQLDGTSWEKIDAKGIEQDDAFFHQVANPQNMGWGEAARRKAWGWLR